MIVCYTFLLAAAISLLFLAEESAASRAGIALLLGVCVAGALDSLLPPECSELIPGGYWRANPRAVLGILLGFALCYPVVTRLLYPLRHSIMASIERQQGKKR